MEERRILEHKYFLNSESYIVDAIIPQNSDICLTLVKNIDLTEPDTKIFVWEYITLDLKFIYSPEVNIDSIICNPNDSKQFILYSCYFIGLFEYNHSKKKLLLKKTIDIEGKEISDITYLKTESLFSLSELTTPQGLVVSYKNNILEFYDENLNFKNKSDLKILYSSTTGKIESQSVHDEEDLNYIKLVTQRKTLFNLDMKNINLYTISRGNLLFNFFSDTSFFFIIDLNLEDFSCKIFSLEKLKKETTEKSSFMISQDGRKIYSIIGYEANSNVNKTFKNQKMKNFHSKKLLTRRANNKNEINNNFKKNKDDFIFHEMEKRKIFYSSYNVDISQNLLEDSNYILDSVKSFYATTIGVYTKFDYDFLTNTALGLDIKNLIISDNPRIVITSSVSTSNIIINQQFSLNSNENKQENQINTEGTFSKGFTDSNNMTSQNFNLNLNFKYIMQAELEYEPTSISIDPFGGFIFVTYDESAYLYSILDNGIREVTKISSTCKGASFSASGKYFAFSTMEFSKEDHNIVVINSRSLEVEYLITNLNGHASKIIWMDSDRIITTLIDEKDVFGWKLADKRIISRNKEKIETNKNKIVGDPSISNSNVILRFVDCGDKIIDYIYDYAIEFLLVLCDEFKVRLYRPNKDDDSWEFDLDCKYLSVLLIRKLDIVIFGTSEGSIRICIWPIPNYTKKGQVEHPHYTEKFLHSGKVIQIISSQDQKFIYSCGSDGSIFISSLTTFCNDTEIKLNTFMYFNPKNILNKRVYLKYSDFTHLTEKMFKTQCDAIKKAELDIRGIKHEFSSEMDKVNGENCKAIDEKRFYVNNAIEKERRKVKDLEENKEILSKELKEKRENQVKSFKDEINVIKKKYKDDKNNLQQNTKNLSNLIKDVKTNYNNYLENIENKKTGSVNKMKAMLDNVLKNLNQKLISIRKIIDSKKFIFEKKINELEEEKEFILKDQQNSNKIQKEINNIKIQELTSELDKINKDNLNYSERIKDWEKNLKELKDNNAELMESFLFNSLKLKQMNKLLHDNEYKISDREVVVKDKRLINDRLEKLRFVLEYQIKNLIKERAPIEEQIKNFEELHNDFYKRFNLLYAEQLNIEEFINDNLNLIDNFKDELSKRKNNLYFLKNLFRALDLEIHFILRAKIEDKNMVLNKLIDIYNKYLKDYVNEDNLNIFALEYKKNSHVMQKEIKKQKNKVLKELKNRRDNVKSLQVEKEKMMLKIQWENSQLIEECSSVRLNLEDILKYINDIEKKFIELTNTHVFLNKNSTLKNIQDGIKKAKETIFQADIDKGKAARESEKMGIFFVENFYKNFFLRRI